MLAETVAGLADVLHRLTRFAGRLQRMQQPLWVQALDQQCALVGLNQLMHQQLCAARHAGRGAHALTGEVVHAMQGADQQTKLALAVLNHHHLVFFRQA